jgi:hypothetical protein
MFTSAFLFISVRLRAQTYIMMGALARLNLIFTCYGLFYLGALARQKLDLHVMAYFISVRLRA